MANNIVSMTITHVGEHHPLDIARALMRFQRFARSKEGALFKCGNDNIWIPLSFSELESEVQKINNFEWYYGNRQLLKLTPADVSNIAKTIMQTELPEMKETRKIATRNGVISSDLEFKPTINPEDYVTRTLDFDYDEDAMPLRFFLMLQRIFQRDTPQERREKMETLQKFYGACLFGIATQYAQALLFLGRGANGKSTLQEIVSKVLFAGRSASIPPDSWNREYSLIELRGIDINTLDELPGKNAFSSTIFKAVITGEPIAARKPYQPVTVFRPHAGHVFAANELPKKIESTDGFLRRIIIMRFKHNFKNDSNKTKSDIAGEIIQKERAGILNWAVNGARKLIRDGKYSLGDWNGKEISAWKAGNDSAGAFLEQMVIKSTTNEIPARTVFEKYIAWCDTMNFEPQTLTAFGYKATDFLEKSRHGGSVYYKCEFVQ